MGGARAAPVPPPLPLREARPGRKRAEGGRWRRGRASALGVPARRVRRGRRRPYPRGRVPSSWRAWGPGGPRPRARCPSFRDFSTCRACGRDGAGVGPAPEQGREPGLASALGRQLFSGLRPCADRARGCCSELLTFTWNRCGRSRTVGDAVVICGPDADSPRRARRRPAPRQRPVRRRARGAAFEGFRLPESRMAFPFGIQLGIRCLFVCFKCKTP